MFGIRITSDVPDRPVSRCRHGAKASPAITHAGVKDDDLLAAGQKVFSVSLIYKLSDQGRKVRALDYHAGSHHREQTGEYFFSLLEGPNAEMAIAPLERLLPVERENGFVRLRSKKSLREGLAI